jgi:hypothetical protein
MNLIRYGTKQPCSNLRYYSDISLEGLEKIRKISVSIVGLRAEI